MSARYIAQMEIDAGRFSKFTPGEYVNLPSGWRDMGISGDTVTDVIQKLDTVTPQIVNTFARRGHFRIVDTEFNATVEDIPMDRARVYGCENYAAPIDHV